VNCFACIHNSFDSCGISLHISICLQYYCRFFTFYAKIFVLVPPPIFRRYGHGCGESAPTRLYIHIFTHWFIGYRSGIHFSPQEPRQGVPRLFPNPGIVAMIFDGGGNVGQSVRVQYGVLDVTVFPEG
jgi:hypothetical protein